MKSPFDTMALPFSAFGTWLNNLSPDDEESACVLEPTRAPWRTLIEKMQQGDSRSDKGDGELEATPPFSSLSLYQVADAIIALFWRHGSYLSVLCAGKPYPSFRRNPELPRIRDEEMHRIQLEFTSGLAYFLDLLDTSPEQAARLVGQACSQLPMTWVTKYSNFRDDYGVAGTPGGKHAAEEAAGWRQMFIKGMEDKDAESKERLREALFSPVTLREEANQIVNAAYRNDSPLEDLHAGLGDEGTDTFGYRRLYQEEVDRLAHHLRCRLGYWLARRQLSPPEWRAVAARA